MFSKFFSYLESVKIEMGKVTWPTRAEIIESARVVLITTLILSIAVFIVDRILSLGLEMIL
ncbi:preprotein translocase subunit SecE [bacterium]|nr:preprotein translocase subunit SecE [bacterium]MBU1637553.1 preprotein translocase subunit SecE [bacterium]MBU1920305.1 preprotein translocase subunit SecE [bacterium]